MKKLLITMVALMAVSALSAQQRVFCQLVASPKLFSTDVTVNIDFGQSAKFFSDERLVDEKGNLINFNSMIDAMNYMATLGWEFEQAVVTVSGDSDSITSTTRWILSRELAEGESAKDGIRTFEEHYQENKKK